jgi:hypothetical protein
MFLAAIVVFHTESLTDTASVAQTRASEAVAVNERGHGPRTEGVSPELRASAPNKSAL